MKNKTNLHFLLALGDKKIVVLKEKEQIHIYSDDKKHAIHAERISEALSSR